MGDNNNTWVKMGKEETEKQFVYFLVEVEVDDLVDLKEAAREKGKNNNNFMSNNNNNNNNNQDNHKDTHKKGALVKVNNTEVALFKYGEEILGKAIFINNFIKISLIILFLHLITCQQNAYSNSSIVKLL